MWENTSSGPSLYHTRRGIGNYLFHIFLTRVVVPLEDGERLVASDCHNPFVVPAFSDLASNERMTDVVEMETFDLCFAAGRLKRPLPSFTHCSAAPREDMPTDGSHLPFSLLLANVL